MIHSLLESNMREAIANPDNQFKDGSINWNFVDADAYHACHNFFRNDADFYEFGIETFITLDPDASEDQIMELKKKKSFFI